MDQTTRKSLTQSLSKLTVEIAAALRVPMRTPGPVQEAAQALHREEQVGQAFDLWTDLLSRRAAVLWVLKSLYVRILEDRGLLQPRRILDAEDELFRQLAPNLGPTAYLRWLYRDLASLRGGLPELFAPQPAELAPVPDPLSQRLIDFWRSKNPDTGELLYRFDDEHFDSRLMGDLYQDLDPVVKKRYALLQTPDFVLNFILDETLTPAIGEWGVETIRILDPACGSGHFLLAAFERLVAGMRAKFPERPVRELVEDVLSRVVGIDLNDYACGLARARLVMTALETCGEGNLASAVSFHPRVFWADALEQVEEDEQLGLARIAPDHQVSAGLLTPLEVRATLRPVLKRGFHVVVANPPYVKERDNEKSKYHKQIASGRQRYVSASGKYSLGAPFTERLLQLAIADGYIGEITADSFMKRDFGKALVEQVLRAVDLQKVVVLSGVAIPGNNTPSAMLFMRRRRPVGAMVRVVSGKRGERPAPTDPALGRAWQSIIHEHEHAGFENEFISVKDIEREVLGKHEWTIGGSEVEALREVLEAAGTPLISVSSSIGIDTITHAGALLEREARDYARARVATSSLVKFAEGDSIRNWAINKTTVIAVSYDRADWSLKDPSEFPGLTEFLWPHRTWLARRWVSGGTRLSDTGQPFWSIPQLPREKHLLPLTICYGEVATHNHFALDDSNRIFEQAAPIIKLRAEDGEGRHHAVLAQLNASTGEFWMKRKFQPKGGDDAGDGARTAGEAWEERYQRNATKLKKFPLVATDDARLQAFSHALHALARERIADAATAVITRVASRDPVSLREALVERRGRDLNRLGRMVGLQEELDWLCYKLYGLDQDAEDEILSPNEVAPLLPGQRPFEITLAREDADRRDAIGRGEEPDEAPTQWFVRHGWEPQTSVDAVPPMQRTRIQSRIERTHASPELSLLEQPTYKRRWYKPDYEKDEREAMELWLDDRLEAWVRERSDAFTAAQAGAALRARGDILAVGELLTGRSDFDVDALIEQRLRLSAVPNLKHHLFKAEGLLKRAGWERVWEEQHKEDRGEPANPTAPDKYSKEDFLKSEYWDLRGKFDVPRERFIAFTEVPPHLGAETLYGWAGWTPRERAKAMLGLDERLEATGVFVVDRHGLLYGVWFLLPYVAWESADAARDFRADVRSLVGENGVTEAMLDEWAKRFPPPKGGKPAKPKRSPSEAKAKKGARAKARAKEDTAT